MGKSEKIKEMSASHERAPQQSELSEEDKSKDAFFVQLAEISEAMIARHGRDFAIGTMILSARFIAEGKPLINRSDGSGETAGAVKPV
jgi:hypothetical protein